MMWPFRKRIFKSLRNASDYTNAVRALVLGSFTSGDEIKGQIDSLIRFGGVIQVISGEKKADQIDLLYLKAIDELAGKPAIAVPAMCHILLNVTGPDKAWAQLVLERIGPPAVQGICRQLQTTKGKMSSHLIRILGRIGDSSAVPTLESVAKEDSEVSEEACIVASRLRHNK